MSIGSVLLIGLTILFLVVMHIGPRSRRWGYYPSGGLGVAVLLLLELFIMGRL